MCACACVGARKRERERIGEKKSERAVMRERVRVWQEREWVGVRERKRERASLTTFTGFGSW